MSRLRDAILKELQRAGGDEFHVSQEFFANVRSLCQEHTRQEAKLAAVVDALNDMVDLASGLNEDDFWYGERRNATERLEKAVMALANVREV